MKSMKMMKKQAQAGFTLIELMIVVAIIGILAAVAIPAYQDYVAKSKFAAALGEISGGKTGYDVKLNDGEDVTAPEMAGLAAAAAPTANCTFAAVAANGGLTCTIVGGPASVKDKVITLARNPTGAWACTTDAEQKFIGPVGVCAGAAAP